MNTTPCVPQPDLAQFVSGKLEAARLEEIASHIDQCENCQDTVIALAEQSDTFVAKLNSPGADDPFESEDALKHGLRQMLAAIRRPARGNGPPLPHRPSAGGQPDQIGPYRIEERLGVGGMGTVFRATHLKLKRSVALKVLPSDRWAHAASISRFEREMEAIGQLDHPHIVRASDAGEDRGMHYLVMEYVDGLDLSRLVRRLGPLPVADACELARQAAVGLQHAHDHGLVHRDIKPSNLMLAWERSAGLSGDAQPRLKILDLGLALLGDEHLQEEHELTTVGQLMGTLDYMSPEQGVDSHAVDLRTDIYGLGATLFKLLTGRAPYADAQYSTLLKKMTALATKPAPSLASVREDLPSGLVQLVDRMLARDPDQRPATAREVAELLVPLTEGANLTTLLRRGQDAEEAEPSIASPAFPFAKALSLGRQPPLASQDNTSRGQAVSPEGRHDGPGRARRWWIAAAAGFLVIVAGIIIRIATDFGEVIVRSDDPDARVVVKRSDETIDEIRLEQGQGVAKIRTGDYEIELAGETAGLTLIPQDKKISVARGQQVQVKVRSQDTAEYAVEDELEKDPQYFQLVTSLRELDRQIRAESKLYGPEHPRIKQLTDERVLMQQRFQQRRSELVPRIKDRLQRLASEESVSPTADQPPETQPGVTTQTEPRYDGKTLEQWFAEMEYERKPERLEEALRAVAATITHPANQDKVDLAIQAIFHVTRQFAQTHQQLELAWSTLQELPADRVAAAMLTELDEGNLHSRQALLWVLYRSRELADRNVTSRLENVITQLASQSAKVTQRVLHISQSGNEQEQDWAIDFLAEFCRQAKIDPTQVQGMIPRFGVALSSHEDGIAILAAKTLVGANADIDSVIATLTRLLQSESSTIQIEAVQLLGSLGPRAEVAVPELAKLLQRSVDERFPGGGRSSARRFSQNTRTDIRIEVIKLLETLGPAAKAALPILRAVAERETAIPAMELVTTAQGGGRRGFGGRNRIIDLRDMAREAIENIEPHEAARAPAGTVADSEKGIDLDSLVRLAEEKLNHIRVRFEAGQASLAELLSAEREVAEARLQRAGDNLQEQLAALDDIVENRRKDLQRAQQAHEAGMVTDSQLTDAEKALLEAQLRQKAVRQKLGDAAK